MAGSEFHKRRVVLAILPGLPVAEDWLEAAARRHDVVGVRLDNVRRREGPLPHSPPETSRVFSPRLKPSRIFWRADAAISGSSLVRFVDLLARQGRHIDAIHGHMVSGLGGLPYVKRRRGIPYVVSVHTSAFTARNPDKSMSPSGSALARRVLSEASAVLPVSTSLQNAMERFGISGEFTVIPNPVDTDRFRPVADQIPGKVVTVARLVPVKRLELMIEAFSYVASQRRDASLDIVGDGPEEQRLQDFVRDLGVADRVVFHGLVQRNRIPQLLSRSAVFGLSSHTENLPVAMIEALACGLPIVGPSVGGIPEIVDGAPGRLFTAGDPSGLAAALLGFLEPSTDVRAAARAVAINRYSIESVGQRLADVYGQTMWQGFE